MKMNQKLGTGLVLAALLGGVSFVAQAKVATVGTLDVLQAAIADSAQSAQQNARNGQLKVAVRTGIRRRARIRGFRGNRGRVSRRIVNLNGFARTGVRRAGVRFRGRHGVRRAIVNINSRARTGLKRRSFNFRGRHGARSGQ